MKKKIRIIGLEKGIRYVKSKDAGWVPAGHYGTLEEYNKIRNEAEKIAKKPNKKYLYAKYYTTIHYQMVNILN